MFIKVLKNKSDTFNIAQGVLNTLCYVDILALYGNLGAGKTFFTQNLCSLLGVKDFVTSPSYVLLNEYKGCLRNVSVNIFHFDLYRLGNLDEAFEIGIPELFSQGISIIEWPNVIEDLLPDYCKKLKFDFDGRLRTVELNF